LLGFLRFNTHPARIFMGDAGSQFLGFVVAWLAITVSQSHTSPMTTLMPLLILGIPIMDILQVVPVRIHKKLPLPGPDKQHFHHQIAKLGFYQYEVVAIIYVLQAVLLLSAYLLRFAIDPIVFAFYAAYVTLILGALYTANTSDWRARPVHTETAGDRRNPLFRRISGLHSFSGKLYGLMVTAALVTGAALSRELPVTLVYAAVLWAAVLLAIKLFSRNLWPLTLGRLATYTTTILVVFGLSLSVQSELNNWLINGSFAVLAILLAVSMRTTRRHYFWLTTEDLLVLLFIVILAPGLPFEVDGEISMGQLIFRTFVSLYACEYVLARGDQARSRLTLGAIFALFTMAIHL
jgi:UDP-GlcNAc:undecaprenyl-phosphate GlcNAc-1-phosphate transferase